MWFRLSLLGACGFWWMLLAWLASNRSTHPRLLGLYSTSYALFLLLLFGVGAALLACLLKPVYDRLYPRRFKLLTLVVSSALGMVALEAIVRLVDPLGISYYEAVNYYNSRLLPDDDLIYRQRPLLHERFFGAEVTTNELGLRERPVGPKSPGELRVLVLGDSVTFGNGVPVEQTFSRRLEELLSRRLGKRVRTINSGVGSYNTFQEAAYFKRDGLLLKPDLVLLLYVQNDWHTHPRPFRPDQQPKDVSSPPKRLISILQKSWLGRLALHVLRTRDGSYQTPPRPDDPNLLESLDSLRSIARVAREHGIPFVGFFWRYFDDPVNVALMAEITKVSLEEGFPMRDVKPWFANVDLDSVCNSKIDSHPNAKGHEIIAKGMLQYLASDLHVIQ